MAANTTIRRKAAKPRPEPSGERIVLGQVPTPKPRPKRPPVPAVVRLRAKLGLTQPEFVRLLPVSVRSLATLEKGTRPTPTVARRLTELARLTDALAEVIRPAALGAWLRTPNAAFDGSKPLEVVERGEADRLWEMAYFLRSGDPV